TVAHVLVKVMAAVLAFLGLAACGFGRQVTLLAVADSRPDGIEIVTTCADGVSVAVEETRDEVRITDVAGIAINGDCLGSVVVELEAPLGERDIVVNGELWIELPPDCPWGFVGRPRGLTESCSHP
ncbi:MAG: hypothetical protein M3349_03975, partial [Actinomycetota bacterium]|nr:hypothetical protein [Actinomycetota bacterium]